MLFTMMTLRKEWDSDSRQGSLGSANPLQITTLGEWVPTTFTWGLCHYFVYVCDGCPYPSVTEPITYTSLLQPRPTTPTSFLLGQHVNTASVLNQYSICSLLLNNKFNPHQPWLKIPL